MNWTALCQGDVPSAWALGDVKVWGQDYNHHSHTNIQKNHAGYSYLENDVPKRLTAEQKMNSGIKSSLCTCPDFGKLL